MTKVCVLVSSYNGETYIKDLIDSLLEQKYVDLQILVRDDGSTDNTTYILDNYKRRYSNFNWYQGDNLGPAKSFLDLIYHAPLAEYYAFCDQDDFWLPEKLYKAIEKIKENIGLKKYGFYFSNVEVVDSNLNHIETSSISGDFNNLNRVLMTNYAIGCTVVITASLLKKVKQYQPQYMKMHDWWIYQLCVALGGAIIFDNNAYILYRQHDSNVIGFNLDTKHSYNVKNLFLKKPEHTVSRICKELLSGYADDFTRENRKIIYHLAFYQKNVTSKMCVLLNNAYFSSSCVLRLKEKMTILFNRI